MRPQRLWFDILQSQQIDEKGRAEVVRLCTAAYREDFAFLFSVLPPEAGHVLARLDGELVSHAAWVTRWLYAGDLPPLRTAYVEAVATVPAHQRRGFGSAVMRRLAMSVSDYDLAALSPANVHFYAEVGWELWRGPLAVRCGEERWPTLGETVMVLRLPRTPRGLDLDACLSADWRPGALW